MAYPPVIAAALSGATLRQLSYWRSGRSAEAPLLAPEFSVPRSRVSYSFRDVVALRTFVYLRSHDVPLERVRQAVRGLRDPSEARHLSSDRMLAINLIGEQGPDNAEMVDVAAAFTSSSRTVVPLYRPEPGLSVDPEIRGGYPVIAGTRVPYDVVAGLLRDGVPAASIKDFYPSVDAGEAAGVLAFAAYVDGYRDLPAA